MSSWLLKLKPRLVDHPQGAEDKKFSVMIASWFGLGRIRPAPGTMGTLGGIPLGILCYSIFGTLGLLVGIVIFFIIGIYASNTYDQLNDTHDSSTIVIDEVVGVMIAGIPALANPGIMDVGIFSV